MADTFVNPQASGRAPGDQNTYNPTAGADFPPGTPVAQSVSADRTVVPGDASSINGSAITGIAVAPGVFEYEERTFGGASIDAHGTALTDDTLEACRFTAGDT